MNNITNYSINIKNEVDKIAETYKKQFMSKHQYIVNKFIQDMKRRGLLIFHSPGTGKSVLASSLVHHFTISNTSHKYKIIFVMAKNLESNMKKNIYKYFNAMNVDKEKTTNIVEKDIKYVSMNASNMYTQLIKSSKTDKRLLFEKGLNTFSDQYTSGRLENTILIIDEFHNLSNSIKNKSKNAINFYHLVMKTKNIKLIFLTGTPVINHPFELVPTFNLLKGYLSKKQTLLPEDIEEFEKYYINTDKTIKNKNKFQNRIMGLVSYYGDKYFDIKNRPNFPKQYDNIIERIPMSAIQYLRYKNMREIELQEESTKFKKSGNSNGTGFLLDKSDSETSSYRIRSRQACNYCIPDYAIKIAPSGKSFKKFIEKITNEDLKDVEQFSPKFKKIIDNINKHPKQLGFVYSEFISGEGLYLFAKILEVREKYVLWGDDEHKECKKYAIITGDTPIVVRTNIIKIFNSNENAYGKLISLLLLSKASAEGVSISNVRHLHIIEPFWNYARIEQIIARGVRYKGHSFLKEDEKNVQPYIYLSIKPTDAEDIELTTDEYLFTNAMQGKKLINDFNNAIIEASIDCSFHSKDIQCRICMPTNEPLYKEDFNEDMAYPDPCKKYTSTQIEVEEVIYDDKKYYYKKDGTTINMYEFVESLNGYVKIKKDNPVYNRLLSLLL